MTPPDSVGKVVEDMQRADLGDPAFEGQIVCVNSSSVRAWATRLQALDRQRQEECETLRVKANTLGDGYLDASHRAQAAEAALAEARTHVTGYVGLAKMTGYDTLIPLLADFLTRTAKE